MPGPADLKRGDRLWPWWPAQIVVTGSDRHDRLW